MIYADNGSAEQKSPLADLTDRLYNLSERVMNCTNLLREQADRLDGEKAEEAPNAGHKDMCNNLRSGELGRAFDAHEILLNKIVNLEDTIARLTQII